MAAIRKPEISANQGTPEALPKGAATDINNAPAGTPPQDGIDPATSQVSQLQPAVATDYQPKYVAGNPDDQFITGPTTRPDESVTTGTLSSKPDVPADAASWLPVFLEASQNPDAPPQLRALTLLLQYHVPRGS